MRGQKASVVFFIMIKKYVLHLITFYTDNIIEKFRMLYTRDVEMVPIAALYI